MESARRPETVTDYYEQLLLHEPKLISCFVPTNSDQQRQAFLDGKIDRPRHEYGTLDAVDFAASRRSIAELGDKLLTSPDLDARHHFIYQQFVDGYLRRLDFLQLAHDYNHATHTDRPALAERYMEVNVELFGLPDEDIYRSLLGQQVDSISELELDADARVIRDELMQTLDRLDIGQAIDRPQPSLELMDWMHGVVDGLYGSMLGLVPDQDRFDRHQLKDLFENILDQEFEESAAGWRVDIEPARSINVRASEKRLIIPDDMPDRSRQRVRQLVVHEIGVHVLRSITGGATDVDLLRTGLHDYYEAEEGLGVVMEQALTGKYQERGVPHYLTAGLAYFDGLDFRQCFEIKWRLAAIDKAGRGASLDEAAIDKLRRSTYGQVMRTFRGTDELPWFKDLAYYNGSVDTWKYLETIKHDQLKFMFVLMGKADPSNDDHERLLYEAHSA